MNGVELDMEVYGRQEHGVDRRVCPKLVLYQERLPAYLRGSQIVMGWQVGS